MAIFSDSGQVPHDLAKIMDDIMQGGHNPHAKGKQMSHMCTISYEDMAKILGGGTEGSSGGGGGDSGGYMPTASGGGDSQSAGVGVGSTTTQGDSIQNNFLARLSASRDTGNDSGKGR